MDIIQNILSGNSAYVYAVAIVITIIALAISTRYALRNLLNIRGVEDVPSSPEAKARKTETCPYDATGNDGDDEADPEGDEDTFDSLGNPNEPQISPRYPDPVDYCEHIQGEIKRVQQSVATRSIEKSLTDEQLQEEREVQRKQLAEIFRLMQEQQDRFGIGSMDEMQDQMKLYAI